MKYAYERFDKELLSEDAAFHTGPEPGDLFPEFNLPVVGGGRVNNKDFWGRPLVVVLASYT